MGSQMAPSVFRTNDKKQQLTSRLVLQYYAPGNIVIPPFPLLRTDPATRTAYTVALLNEGKYLQ